MTDERRIERLEKDIAYLKKVIEYDRHTLDMATILIEKLCKILERQFSLSYQYREEIKTQLRGIRSRIEIGDSEIQEHFKEHKTKRLTSKNGRLLKLYLSPFTAY